MLRSAVEAMVNHIITNVPTFTPDTCKGYDDISVFDEALTTMESPECVIVGFGGARRMPAEISEFGGLLLQWFVVVNGFFALRGDDMERQEAIERGYAFVENLISSVVNDSTLGGLVMDAVMIDAEPPLEYLRNGVETYLLMAVRFGITENL